MSFGCSGKKAPNGGSAHKGKGKTEKDATPIRIINLRDGSVTYAGTKGEQLFLVRFQQGQTSIATDGPMGDTTGTFHDVSGDIYQGAKTASTFIAKEGQGDQKKQILTLSNQVRVTSKDPPAVLTCDRMIYDGKRKLIKAIGNVRVMGTWSNEDAIKEVWATPNLKKFATPDSFDQP